MGSKQDEHERVTASSVEYHVDNLGGTTKVFTEPGKAAALAIAMCLSGRVEVVNIDMLVFDRNAAEALGRAEEYDEDPDASVFERIEVRATSLGRIP